MGTMCDNFIIYEDNQNEFKMWQGLVGAHYTPYVDGAGNLSWTNNGGLPNPPTVNVSGKGLTITGIAATTGDLPATANQFDCYLVGTAEPYYVYMYYENAWVNIGEIGKGEQGEPGFSPVVTVSPITGGHQISITDAEDTETFNVMDGEGVPTGGTTGQVLKKSSSTDFDTEWGSVEALPTGGTTGQVLAKKTNANYDVEWVNPSGGGADPATATPLMDGTAAVGTATKYAREDHVHPSNTTKVDKTVTIAPGTDLNTVLTSGFYRLENNNTNMPTGCDDWSQMIVSRGNDTIAQIIVSYSNGKMFVRAGNGIGGTPSWAVWKQVLNESSASISFTVTLSSSSWSSNAQTVSDAKFIASGYAYIVSPASASFADYGAAQIYADDVSTDGSMTFHCADEPTSNLTVNIVRVVAS